jgi:hypothetical protein
MTSLIDLINADATIERSPAKAHYYGLIDAFNTTIEELGADSLSRQEKLVLEKRLASDYYAILACAEHNNHPSMSYVYENVAESYGIDRTPSFSKEEQKAADARYEAEYLEATELGLIEAQNALRLPRLSKVQREMHEDDVIFYGSELVCHERSFKNAARRRKCTKLIGEHKIDRTALLQYHRA